MLTLSAESHGDRSIDRRETTKPRRANDDGRAEGGLQTHGYERERERKRVSDGERREKREGKVEDRAEGSAGREKSK